MSTPNPFAQFVEETDEKPADNPFQQFVSKEPPPETTAEQTANDSGLKEVAPGIFEYIVGGVEIAGTVASSILAEPVAGIAGMGTTLTGGAQAGAETVEGVREAMTYQPGTETGKEMMGDVASFLEPVGAAIGAVETGIGEATLAATGSPEAAAMAHTIPTALMEMLGLGLLKKPSLAAMRAAKAQERVRIDPTLTPEQAARQTIDPETRSYQQITQDLKAGKTKALAKDVRPDEEIVAAAEALGVELNPSHYSTNEAYRRVEQAVKSQPGTQLAAKEALAIEKLGEQADALIGDLSGQIDKSILDVQVRGKMEGTIKKLEDKAKEVYGRINGTDKKKGAIPPATKITARASRAYMAQRLEDLGGNTALLTTAEKKLYGLLNADRPPTYNGLDTMRRDVGDAYSRQGPFKDDTSGTLNQVYEAVIQDQQGVADVFGAGADFAAGRKLVETRKQVEKQAMQMFGQKMNQSLLPKLRNAAMALTKGDVVQFKNMMEALPKNLRTPAAATMLNDLFTASTRTGGSLGQGFAKAYTQLNRNLGAKDEIFKYLPKAAQRRFDAIGKVSQGIFRAKALENTSRTARDILHALESGGLIARITDQATEGIINVGRFTPGLRAASTGAKAVKDAGKAMFDKTKAADNLMASRDLERAIGKAAEGQVKEAETILKRSKAWQAFRNTLGEGTKTQLTAMGPIAWLTHQDEPIEGQPVGQ